MKKAKTVGTVFDNVVHLVQSRAGACTEDAAYTWNGVAVKNMTAGVLNRIYIKLVNDAEIVRTRNAKWED